MRGLSTVLVVTAVFVVFHFTMHWTWRQTFLVPLILAIFFPALWLYEQFTGKKSEP